MPLLTSPLYDPNNPQATEPSLGLPSYLVAADTHSIANDNQTFIEGALETVSNIPKFIGLSVISGANQLYNIAPTLGNYAGGDFELSKTGDIIKNIDDDLGTYYQEHAESIDTMGFILSSLAPGAAGIKVLNAGQKMLEVSLATGKYGKTMKSALSLLTDRRTEFLSKAKSEITNSNSLSLITNVNTMKAMGAGYGQAVLETAAFETATAVALSESPVLDEQDLGDIVTNIAVGGVIFGSIGGVFNVTKTHFAIKNAVVDADLQASPLLHKSVLTGPSASNKIVNDLDQIDTIMDVPKDLPPERIAFLERARKGKIQDLKTQVRGHLGDLADKDQVVANQMEGILVGQDFQTNLGAYLGATKISRLTDVSKAEKLLDDVGKRVKAGTSKPEDLKTLADSKLGRSYTTTWGDTMNNVTGSAPQHIALSDTLKKGQNMIIKGNKLTVGKQKFTLNTKGINTVGGVPGKGTGWDVTTASLQESQARAILALEIKPFKGAVTVNENDVHLIDKMYREFNPANKIAMKDGSLRSFADDAELMDFIYLKKQELANDMLQSPLSKNLSQEDIASAINVRPSFLSGQISEAVGRDVFALQSYAKEYTDIMIDRGLASPTKGVIEVYKQPRTIKTTYDTSVMDTVDGHVLEGMAIITQQEKLHRDKINNVTAGYFGNIDNEKYLDLSVKDIMSANRTGAGGKFFTAASANPGTLASKAERLGQVTNGIMIKKDEALKTLLQPAMVKLTQNPKAVVEFSSLQATLRSIPDNYVVHESGQFLEPAVIARYNALLAEGKSPKIPRLKAPDAPKQIPIKNPETLELARAHIRANGERTNHLTSLRTSQGNQFTRDADVFYPTPVDPKEYPFFALVEDQSITSTGRTKTIYATNENDLATMIKKATEGDPTLKIYVKGGAERYFKSKGEFDDIRSLGDNYLDTAMQRKGVSSPFFVPTDPQKVVEDLLNWHTRQEKGLVREMVSAKYERQFEELRKRGEVFTDLATSQFNNLALVKHAENVVKNPYMDYIKTALNVKNYSDYPFWVNASKMLDDKVSEMYDKVTRVVENAKSPAELAEANSLLKQYGYKGAAYDMEMDLLINHTAPKGALLGFVQKANAILATVVLRLDHLNAANNYIASNILYGAEMKAITRAISRGDEAAIGDLAKLRNIKVPGVDATVPSPQKLLANAYKAYGKDSAELAYFKENGFVTSITDQYKWTLDNLTLSGKETVVDLNSKVSRVHDAIKNAATKGERWTGNRLAEEFNRFAAAHTMKQVTDIAVKHGIMDERTALSYINSFVNRTQGNYLASQRPMLFQGAIGQSIGLFQTYQFNLMQQLLRHMGEGTAKDTATLLGLQATVFGLNGLPAFNAINTHIVGTASGNDNHKDFYTTVYGAAGKDAGDWLMYGLASNMLLHPDLKTNLYVRGDINPRHLTIVPTNPELVPIVQATGKFIANIFDTASKIKNGGDVSTAILQGIEHNGISRPLAGLAQTLEGLNNPEKASYSTSKRGNVIASNDLLALTNLTRLVGGKPLGEAIAVDAAYRFKTYALKDSKKRGDLGKAIKSTVIAGGQPTTEQIESFAETYVSLGGKQTEFNTWMGQLYKAANTSQANELRRNLGSPFSQNMQLIMGGYELNDFTN